MKDLTIVILTGNEEKHIRKCVLSACEIARRIVIVDSFSDDATKQICEELKEELAGKGCTLDFYQNEWVNHARQFNWGIDNTGISTGWIMRLDADETITKELSDELNEKLDAVSAGVGGIEISRRVVFMGKWIRHGGIYPTYLLRIFRNGYGRCEQLEMDEHIVLSKGETIRFHNDIVDENLNDLTWWVSKHNGYSNKERNVYLEKLDGIHEKNAGTYNRQAKRKRVIKHSVYYKLPPFLRARLYFIYRYYFRLGFLDGTEGKIFHFLQAYWYRFLVDSKIYEAGKNRVE